MDFSLMSYREAAPAKDVAPLVLSFWEFASANEDFGTIEHEIFPDGCISVYYLRNKKFNFSELAFNGLHLESITTTVYPKSTLWGMRFSPAACANVLRSDPQALRDVPKTEAEGFPHLTRGLLDELNACRDFEEAVAVYENRLKSLNFGQNSYDEKVAEALRIIEEIGGEIKIAELAEALNLSTRQFERRFKASSGLSPKQYARTRRLRATAVAVVENEKINWANRAAEMGFSDQSHLTHEFVSVTKRSPNSFAEKVGQIKHGKLVK
jgi:AraC-like DNA-binding protein